MKQTAVDYLFEKLWGIHKDKFTWQMILKEAKKKHKKEIIDAFKAGAFYPGHELESEQYYFEKYENEIIK
jgi:Rps23 Pro-64 3,4-dihydroxylase Tpa1-like proline 4-hydroxylase